MVKEKEARETEETTSTTMEKADETTSSDKMCKEAEETTSSTSEEVKKAGYEENPEEGASEGAKESNTLTPGKMSGKPQNVFTPPTNIPGSRMASGGGSPSDVHYSGKSADTDFQKSPLFNEMNKQMDALSKAFSSKLDSVEKSMQDRFANILKMMEKIDAFNHKSFNKAYAENITEKGMTDIGVEDALKAGKARFVQ